MYVGKQAISLQKTALLEIVFMMKLLQFQKQKQNEKPTLTKKGTVLIAWLVNKRSRMLCKFGTEGCC